MNKHLTTAVLLVLLTASAGAVSITPQTPVNETLEPGGDVTKSFDITFDSNDEEVKVAATTTGDYDVSYKSFRIFDSDGTFTAEIEAPASGNYTHDVAFSFQRTYTDGNNTKQETLTRSFTATTKIPYFDLQKPVWVNDSFTLDFDGETRDVSAIRNNLFLANNSIKVEDQTTVNNVRLHVEDIVPGAWAKIRADSQDEEATFDYEYVPPVDDTPDECLIEFQQVSVQLQRDATYTFRTLNSVTGDRIPEVSVDIYDENGLLKSKQSESDGKVRVYIPPEAKGDLEIDMAKPDHECKSNTQIESFGNTREEFQENNPEFQLELTVDNNTVYDKITGNVLNKEGDYPGDGNSNFVTIETPDGDKTDVTFNESGFTYAPDTAGEYKVSAEKHGYKNAETQLVEYVADKDGDGVPNTEDDCPETPGVASNNGCEKKEPQIEVIDQEERQRPEMFTLQTPYLVRVVDPENRETIDYNGNITVDGQTVEMREGVSKVRFADTGTKEIAFNGSAAYDATDAALRVEQPSAIPDFGGLPLWAYALLGAGFMAVVGYILYSGGSGSGKRQKKKTDMDATYDASEGLDLDG